MSKKQAPVENCGASTKRAGFPAQQRMIPTDTCAAADARGVRIALVHQP